MRFDYGVEGSFLGGDGNSTAFFATASSRGDSAVIGLSRLGRVAGANGSGELCTLYFDAIGPGNASMTFARGKVRDSSNRILDATFQVVRISVHESPSQPPPGQAQDS
jgi:hypothetical protein